MAYLLNNICTKNC